jgi:hypothetical protein
MKTLTVTGSVNENVLFSWKGNYDNLIDRHPYAPVRTSGVPRIPPWSKFSLTRFEIQRNQGR